MGHQVSWRALVLWALVAWTPSLSEAGSSVAAPTVTYTVSLETGSDEHADTRANIHVQLFGTSCNTAELPLTQDLAVSTHDPIFMLGQTDVFKLEAPDVGEVVRMVLRRDSYGAGAGWYVMRADVTVVAVGTRYGFTLDRWVSNTGFAPDEAETYLRDYWKENFRLTASRQADYVCWRDKSACSTHSFAVLTPAQVKALGRCACGKLFTLGFFFRAHPDLLEYHGWDVTSDEGVTRDYDDSFSVTCWPSPDDAQPCLGAYQFCELSCALTADNTYPDLPILCSKAAPTVWGCDSAPTPGTTSTVVPTCLDVAVAVPTDAATTSTAASTASNEASSTSTDAATTSTAASTASNEASSTSTDAATTSTAASTASNEASSTSTDAATTSTDASTASNEVSSASTDAATTSTDASTASIEASSTSTDAATTSTDASTSTASIEASSTSTDATTATEPATTSTDATTPTEPATTSTTDVTTASADAATLSTDAPTSNDVTTSTDATTHADAATSSTDATVTSTTFADALTTDDSTATSTDSTTSTDASITSTDANTSVDVTTSTDTQTDATASSEAATFTDATGATDATTSADSSDSSPASSLHTSSSTPNTPAPVTPPKTASKTVECCTCQFPNAFRRSLALTFANQSLEAIMNTLSAGLKKEHALNRSELSATKNRKLSKGDDRVSSGAVGYIAVGVLAGIVLLLFLSDLVHCRQLCRDGTRVRAQS